MMQGVHFRVALWVTSDPRSDVIVVVGGVVGGQAEQRRQSVAVPAAVHAVHPTGGQFAASLLGRRAARRPRSHEQTLPGNAGISAEVNPPPPPPPPPRLPHRSDRLPSPANSNNNNNNNNQTCYHECAFPGNRFAALSLHLCLFFLHLSWARLLLFWLFSFCGGLSPTKALAQFLRCALCV